VQLGGIDVEKLQVELEELELGLEKGKRIADVHEDEPRAKCPCVKVDDNRTYPFA